MRATTLFFVEYLLFLRTSIQLRGGTVDRKSFMQDGSLKVCHDQHSAQNNSCVEGLQTARSQETLQTSCMGSGAGTTTSGIITQ